MNVGDKVYVPRGNGARPATEFAQGTVVKILDGESLAVAVEFTGPEWYYPYRAWFDKAECSLTLPEVTP